WAAQTRTFGAGVVWERDAVEPPSVEGGGAQAATNSSVTNSRGARATNRPIVPPQALNCGDHTVPTVSGRARPLATGCARLLFIELVERPGQLSQTVGSDLPRPCALDFRQASSGDLEAGIGGRSRPNEHRAAVRG